MRGRIRADRHGQDDPLSDTSTAATYWSVRVLNQREIIMQANRTTSRLLEHTIDLTVLLRAKRFVPPNLRSSTELYM